MQTKTRAHCGRRRHMHPVHTNTHTFRLSGCAQPVAAWTHTQPNTSAPPELFANFSCHNWITHSTVDRLCVCVFWSKFRVWCCCYILCTTHNSMHTISLSLGLCMCIHSQLRGRRRRRRQWRAATSAHRTWLCECVFVTTNIFGCVCIQCDGLPVSSLLCTLAAGFCLETLRDALLRSCIHFWVCIQPALDTASMLKWFYIKFVFASRTKKLLLLCIESAFRFHPVSNGCVFYANVERMFRERMLCRLAWNPQPHRTSQQKTHRPCVCTLLHY